MILREPIGLTVLDIFKASERAMSMSDEVWARHASPWSVWTRFTTLPLFALAVWSRAWLGWWALLPVALAVVWVWLNPRVFPAPATFDHWPGRGTRGERLYLERASVPIPAHHARAATVLTVLSAIGLPPFVYGLWVLDPGWTVAGLALMMMGKAWFVDRMVWLHADVTGDRPA